VTTATEVMNTSSMVQLVVIDEFGAILIFRKKKERKVWAIL